MSRTRFLPYRFPAASVSRVAMHRNAANLCEASRVSRRLLSVRRSYNEQRKEQVFT